MARFEKLLASTEDLLHFVGCSALVLIAILINVDVFARLLLDSGLQFQFEAVELYLMPAVAMLSLARVYRDNAHISLEVLPTRLLDRVWPVARVVMLLGSAFFFAAVTIMAGRQAWDAFLHDEVYFGYFDWPLGWAYLSIPVGAALLTIRLLTDLVNNKTAHAATQS